MQEEVSYKGPNEVSVVDLFLTKNCFIESSVWESIFLLCEIQRFGLSD